MTPLNGKQKAAMLLLGLDALTAAQLIKGLDPAVVKEIAVEVAYLDAAGLSNSEQFFDLAREFCEKLKVKKKTGIDAFLNEMLRNSVGDNRANDIREQIQGLVQKKDPFIPIKATDPKILASILANEHPQVISVILKEVAPKSGSEILSILETELRSIVVARMASGQYVSSQTRKSIAELVVKKLEKINKPKTEEEHVLVPQEADESLRKLSITLRNLSLEIRDALLNTVEENNSQASERIKYLMVLWEDVPEINDRSLQQCLRGIDNRQFALAFMEADERIIKKFKANMSERAAAAVDEEASLMAKPKKEEIEEAREKIVAILREKNSQGELSFGE